MSLIQIVLSRGGTPMTLARKLTIATAIVALALACADDARSDEKPLQPAPAPDIAPIPAEPSPPAVSEIEIIPAAKIPVAGAGGVNAADYVRIYRTIPFNRAEYRVNPNYRHDSTMEILTGKVHHQTVIRHNFEHKQPVQRVPQPARPSRLLTPVAGPWWYWSASSAWRWFAW